MTARQSQIAKFLLGTLLVTALLIGGGTARGLYTDLVIVVLSLATAAVVFGMPPVRHADRMPYVFSGAILLLCILQVVPLPDGLLAGLRPGFLDQPPGLDTSFTFASLGVGRTIESLSLVAAPIAFFLCVLRLRADQATGLLPFFFVGLFSNLLVGMLQFSFSADAAVDNFLPFQIHAGLFANVNHFSTLLFVSIPLIVYFGLYKGHMLLGVLGLAAVLLILLAAESRAGVLLGLAVTVLSLIVLPARNRVTIGGVIALFAAVAIYSAGAWSKIDTENLDPEFGRMEFARTTLQGIGENWPLGIGFGNFVEGYKIYEKPEMIYPQYVNHAHNDYLELVFEGGLPAALMIGFYLLLLARVGLSGGTDVLQRAALLSIVFILVHSLVDYPLRTMALAMTFALLNGILFHAGLRRAAPAKDGLIEVEHNGERMLVPIAQGEAR